VAGNDDRGRQRADPPENGQMHPGKEGEEWEVDVLEPVDDMLNVPIGVCSSLTSTLSKRRK